MPDPSEFKFKLEISSKGGRALVAAIAWLLGVFASIAAILYAVHLL